MKDVILGVVGCCAFALVFDFALINWVLDCRDWQKPGQCFTHQTILEGFPVDQSN